MTRSTRLAVVSTHLRPATGFGGVAESTSEVVKALSASGHALRVIVSDGTRGPPLTSDDFCNALGAEVHAFRTLRAAWAAKWGFGLEAVPALWRAVRWCDCLYVSGIATWPTSLAPLFAVAARKPFVVAPRGSLMADFWRHIKRTRPIKRIYYWVLVFPALRFARAVHATSELEAQPVRELLPGVPVRIIPNAFAAFAEGSPPALKPDAGLRILYLGRVAREKGILGFARRFAEARGPQDRLVVAGPAEDDYGQQVVALCEATPGFHYMGVLDRAGVRSAVEQSNALALPSGVDAGGMRENFGNVVVEGLLLGRPVLVTRGLAWDGLEEAAVGILFDRDLQDLPQALARLRSLVSDAHVAERAALYAHRNFSPNVVAGQLWRACFPDGDEGGGAVLAGAARPLGLANEPG